MVARVSIIAEYRVERISKYIYFVVISMLLVGIFLFVVAPLGMVIQVQINCLR